MVEDVQTTIIGRYFEGGWRIAPFLKTPDGYIGVKGWPKRAATNMAELQALIEERQGKSNRKLLFGVVPPRGKYIVDVDLKKNTSALQLWKDKVLEQYADPLLATSNLVVKTKSGGYHLYYSDGSDRQLHSPTSVFGKDSGVDIRGYTGMVIMPSSIGTEEDWQPGEYTIIRGDPSKSVTVLGLAKILGEKFDQADNFTRETLYHLNEALRNDTVNELYRFKLIPDNLIIPESNRDNTLYRAARLCRLAGISQDAALLFMRVVGSRCQESPEEPQEHWIKLAEEKVRRVYASEEELKLGSISQFYEELDNAGTVLLRGVAKSYYYFRHGSKILRIDPRSKYSTDNISNVMAGLVIETDEGSVPVKKCVGAYNPRDVAYNAAMYPKGDMPFFNYEDQRYVNTYHDPFATFEPDREMLAKAELYVPTYLDYVHHITGGDDDDAKHLLSKIAWMVQRPYRRLPTATIIYSHTRGSGKDVFMALLREIIGRKYYAPITLDSLESEFLYVHDKLVCTASEVQLQTNARGTIAAANFMGKIKDLITAKFVNVNEKFQQPYNAPIFTNFFILSNFELSAIIEPGDRRFDIFHATEQKLDQDKFGLLADVTNDGLWLERHAADQHFRQHVIFAIREYLKNVELSSHFDREEARMNEVKRELMEYQAPPAMQWLRDNLPEWFTEDLIMMACHFCPLKVHPEYAFKQLKEYFANELKPVYRDSDQKQMFRIGGAPRFEKRDDGMGRGLYTLNFAVESRENRKPLYHFVTTARSKPQGEQFIKQMMKRWYEMMSQQYSGMVTKLPAQKPDTL